MPVLDLVNENGEVVGQLRGDQNGNLLAALRDNTQSGTTAERDVAYPTPTGGETWDNTDLGYREFYNSAAGAWQPDLRLLYGALQVTQSRNNALFQNDAYTTAEAGVAHKMKILNPGSAGNWLITPSKAGAAVITIPFGDVVSGMEFDLEIVAVTPPTAGTYLVYVS